LKPRKVVTCAIWRLLGNARQFAVKLSNSAGLRAKSCGRSLVEAKCEAPLGRYDMCRFVPDGQITDFAVQPLSQKYSGFLLTQITSTSATVPSHEGRIAIVTDAGRNAMDVAAPLTNGAQADGKDVWS
jgi:hypothetical protein